MSCSFGKTFIKNHLPFLSIPEGVARCRGEALHRHTPRCADFSDAAVSMLRYGVEEAGPLQPAFKMVQSSCGWSLLALELQVHDTLTPTAAVCHLLFPWPCTLVTHSSSKSPMHMGYGWPFDSQRTGELRPRYLPRIPVDEYTAGNPAQVRGRSSQPQSPKR